MEKEMKSVDIEECPLCGSKIQNHMYKNYITILEEPFSLLMIIFMQTSFLIKIILLKRYYANNQSIR